MITHISSLRWEHINFFGEYFLKKNDGTQLPKNLELIKIQYRYP